MGSSTGFGESYSYHAGASAYGANAKSALVSGIANPNLTQSYAYDANGNITSFTLNGQTCTYAYDDLGQLIRVNDPVENATWVYAYDRGGNIQSKKRYAYTTGALGAVVETIPYTYDSTWKDKLTSYGGVTIQSDALGNVTSDGVWSYTWEGGRRLAGMSKSGTTVSFKYDENGQRIKKIVNGVTTEYTVQGKRVVHVKNDSLGQLHIYYDGTRPDMVLYNGATYRYVHSLQGDILGLQDSAGNLVVEYRYDAWGRQVSKTGSLANSLGTLTPFRYRGYVYDEDTSLYYLRSRYYNPEWGRFISPDSLLGHVGSLLQHNLFAYCRSNPVVRVDKDGAIDQGIYGEGSSGCSGGEVNWGFGLICGGVVYGVSLISRVMEKSQSSRSITLDDVKVDTATNPNGEYYLAYVNGNGELIYDEQKPLSFVQALGALGITGASNSLMERYAFIFANAPKEFQVMHSSSRKKAGIYTKEQTDAKMLGMVLGCTQNPEVQCSGYYGHYHDSTHKIHIWYGTPVWY